jgi:hypothetical protein
LALTLMAAATLSYAGAGRAVSPKLAAPGAGNQDLLLAINAGRLDVMMDEVDDLLSPRSRTHVDSTSPPATDHLQSAMNSLSSAVTHYQRLLPVACQKRIIAKQMCTGIYRPGWLTRRVAAPPKPEVVRGRIEDAQRHLEPLWSAVCDDGRRRTGNDVCPIE